MRSRRTFRYSLMVAALFPGISAAMLVGAGYFLDRERRAAAAV